MCSQLKPWMVTLFLFSIPSTDLEVAIIPIRIDVVAYTYCINPFCFLLHVWDMCVYCYNYPMYCLFDSSQVPRPPRPPSKPSWRTARAGPSRSKGQPAVTPLLTWIVSPLKSWRPIWQSRTGKTCRQGRSKLR